MAKGVSLNNKLLEWIKKNKKFLLIGVLGSLGVYLLYNLAVNNEIYALELDASYYECEEGTTMTTERVADVNDGNIEKYLCYVRTGVKASCPMDVESEELTASLGDDCSLTLNQVLTDIRGVDTYFYMPIEDSIVDDSTNLNQACLNRNYVHTAENDTEYYGYYKTACVCYGSYENVAQCGNRQWLNKEVSDDDYRYYIQTQDEMTCENGGTPIVIGNGGEKKGDLYACSLGEAKLKKREVLLNFSFSADDFSKSSLTEEFEVANAGEIDVIVDKIGVSEIEDADYELDKENSICSDSDGNIYEGSIVTDTFVVNGASLDSSVRFLEDITCDLVFKKKTYAVKVSISEDSTGSGEITSLGKQPDATGNFYVTDGGDISVDAIANDDSKYVSTTCEEIGGSVTTTESEGVVTKGNIAFSDIKSDIECSVTFEKRKQYTVSALVVGSGGTAAPTSSVYYEGAKPMVMLTADLGYAIDEDKTVCDNNNYSISGSSISITKGISSDVECSVYFKAVDYTVIITPKPVEGSKSISIIYNDDVADKNPNYGDKAVVMVVPNIGYSYTGNNCGSDGSEIEATNSGDGYSFNFVVEGNKNCEVTFSKNSYKVSAELQAGDYTGGAVKVGSSSVEYGEDTTIEVVNPSGYTYDPDNTICIGEADINKSISPINISNISSNVNCSIAFKANSYKVNVDVNDSSMGSVSQSKTEVTINEEIVVTVNPNTGYEYVTNNCGTNGSEQEISEDEDGNLIFKLSNLSASKSCEVTLAKKEYKISVEVEPSVGGIFEVEDEVVEHGSDTSILLTANIGYEYDSHSCRNSLNESVEATINSSKDTITLSDVTDDISCVINYKLKEYTVTVTYDPILSVVDGTFGVDFADDNGDGKVKNGDSVFINYEVNEGYSYSSNTCGAREYSANQLIIESVGSDIDNCVVTFVKNAYTVGAEVSSGKGSVVVNSKSVEYNGNSSIIATSESGYVYDRDNTTCSGNAIFDKESSLIKISNISSNVECKVAFKLGEYNVEVLVDETDEGAGEVSQTPVGSVDMNEEIEVIVTPNSSYEYESNTCGANSDEVPAEKDEVTGKWTFTISNVTSDRICYVSFKKIFKVSATAVNGKIDSLKGDFENDDDSVSVYENKDAEIVISPNENYVYVSNDCGAIANADNSKLTVVNVNEDKVCNVRFEEKAKHKVDVTSKNDDYGVVSPNTQEVYDGDDAKVEVKVTDGNEFFNVVCNDKIVSNAILSGSELIIPNVIEDLVCVVNYKDVLEYNVVAKSSNEDFGKVTPDIQTVANGGNATITLVYEEGYEYEDNDCGAEFIDEDELILKNVTSNRSCVVFFKEKEQYTIVAKPTDDKTGSVVTNDDFVYSGDDTSIVVVPSQGYEYESNDCGAVYDNGLLILTNVTSNKNCNVSFKNNVSKMVDSENNVENVSTGDKTYIVYFICLIGVIGGVFGYRKYLVSKNYRF